LYSRKQILNRIRILAVNDIALYLKSLSFGVMLTPDVDVGVDELWPALIVDYLGTQVLKAWHLGWP
jgi:hypothetical protein